MTILQIFILLLLIISCSSSNKTDHNQIKADEIVDAQINEVDPREIINQVKLIPAPESYSRVLVKENSFAEYLRNLYLKTENNAVVLFDGNLKENQTAQYRVLKMDVGDKDLQQCADAVMRLWAEYLFEQKLFEEIHFNFTNGDVAKWNEYAEGYRPTISGNSVSWNKTKDEDYSYPNFREYLNLVFNYAGSYSLSKELKQVQNPSDIKAGDVFIYGGFPGHAVIVLDVALNKTSSEKVFLLAQSYMPAQEIHILINPVNDTLSPWYQIPADGILYTPEWTFELEELKSF